MIFDAVRDGARKPPACGILGISVRTLQRWSRCGEDQRKHRVQRPSNALSNAERRAVLACCNTPEHRSLSPKQIVPRLADQGEYLASESTFQRILKDASQQHRRGRAARPSANQRPRELTATGPGQVFSWDITYLRSPVRGAFYYLYLFMDVFSRKIVGWEVAEDESSELAAELLRKIILKERLSSRHVALHSDNGSPMKGATMLATMQRLGVVPSFSRPAVSNDNPFSESLFRTMKYVPIYPEKPFESLEATREWVNTFVRWYNEEHRHSGIKYVTPGQRHRGQDDAILVNRKHVYEAAKRRHPARWSGKIRNWEPIRTVVLNPCQSTEKKSQLRAA
jgi:putative transposase